MNSQDLRDRTKAFAIEIIRYLKGFDVSYERSIIGKQLIRSSTSLAANYRAACRGRSKAEYYAKLSIVIEEADETQFWLEVLLEAGLSDQAQTRILLSEATELLKIFSASRKTFKVNNRT